MPRPWGQSPSKFGAYTITITAPDGRPMTFPSHMQAAYVIGLWQREAAGEIWGLELEPEWTIWVGNSGGHFMVGVYKPDACWYEHDQRDGEVFVAVDVGTKNTRTAIKNFKLRCILALYGVPVELVQVSGSRTEKAIKAWQERTARTAA